MKLPNFTQFEPLNNLRHLMGAELGKFTSAKSSPHLTPDEIDRLARIGIEIPLDQVRVLDDGTLAYKDSRVVLYIRDVTQHRKHVLTEQDMPRFHISDCKKLEEMRRNKRFERYVVSTREDGLFVLNTKHGESREYRQSTERLKICQFCLGKMEWERFSYRMPYLRKMEIVRSFTLHEFFKKYGKTLITKSPSHTAASAPLNEYTKDFREVANSIKRQRNHLCDKCRRDFSRNQKWLEAHHINGIRSDHRPSNIAILCLGCHADEYLHSHMKSLPKYLEFIRLFGLAPSQPKR
jgi:hypothetical protein